MVQFAYGNADFAEIRRSGCFYVDKTPFLPLLESPTLGGKNLVFLRPRRFGKSCLLSMLKHYYDIGLASEYDELFRGLWVYDHPTPEKSRYMVLHLNFSTMTASSDEAVLQANFAEVLKSSLATLSQRYQGRIQALDGLASRMDSFDDASSLMSRVNSILSGAKDKLYILIDEYDTFANALISANETQLYDKITDKFGFVRAFYRTLKAGADSGAVGRVFITGGTPILLDDLVSGFNVATYISNREHYNTLAGFTQTDVERALDEFLRDQPALQAIPEIGARDRLLATLETYYDGYRFSPHAAERIFNSTMVIYFLRELAMSGRYPANMLDGNTRTDYEKLHAFWASAGPAAEGRRKIIETLLMEREVWSPLVDRFGTREEPTDAQFVSLMYYTGMLTLAPEPPNVDEILFVPPNRVMRDLGLNHYARLMRDLEQIDFRDRSLVGTLKTMGVTGDIAPFLEKFRKECLATVSNRDTMSYDERSMKMLLIGALTTTGVFFVFNELEAGHGYFDLCLVPNPTLRKGRFAWLFELKYLPTNATDKDLENKFTEADGQLTKYMADEKLLGVLSKGLELRAGTIVFLGCSRMEWRAFAPVVGVAR